VVSPKYHIFVCTSCRTNGTQKGFCHQKDSVKILGKFIQEIEDRDLTGGCMVSNTGASVSAAGVLLPSFTRRASGTAA